MNRLESLSCFVVVMMGLGCGSSVPVPYNAAPHNAAPVNSGETSEAEPEMPPAQSDAAVAAPILAQVEQEEPATQPAQAPTTTLHSSASIQVALGSAFGDAGGAFQTVDMKITVPKSGGGLSIDRTRRVLEMARSAFVPCMSLAQGEAIENRATFLVSPRGALSKIRLFGGSSKVRACLRESLGRVLFPDAAKATSVVATFTTERLGVVGILSGSRSYGGLRQRGASPPKPSMRIKSFKSTGALATVVTRRVVRLHRDRLRYCYERELQRNPAFVANVRIELRIGANGGVAQLKAKTPNRGLKMCVEQRVRVVQFPKAIGDTVITQVIEFRPPAGTIAPRPKHSIPTFP